METYLDPQHPVVSAAQRLLAAFGGDTPDWIAAEAQSLEDSLAAAIGAAAPVGTTDLPAAAAQMLDLMTDAMAGDADPAAPRFLASMRRVSAALGVEPSELEVMPVWWSGFRYCDEHGEPQSWNTESTAPTMDLGRAKARRDFDRRFPSASKVDQTVQLVAGVPAAIHEEKG